jgi:NitT/TauT family transport system substrate-binding protein
LNWTRSAAAVAVPRPSGGLEAITVASLPVTFASALALGVERGYFDEQGLTVNLKPRSVSAILFAVASDSCDFGYASIPALVAGYASGLRLKVVANAAGWSRDPAAATLQVVTPRGSPIVAPKDLEWRKLAVDAFGQLPHVSVIVAARKLGVDAGKIRFVDMPYAKMPRALASGEVDAADMGEPYLTEALDAGASVVLSNSQGFAPESTQAVWVTSAGFASDHPDTVGRFRQAIERSNDHCAASIQDARQVMTTFTSTTPAAAARIRMPHFSNRVDRGNFKLYLETIRSLGFTWSDLDLESLFLS